MGMARILIPKQTFTKLAAVYAMRKPSQEHTARGFVIAGKKYGVTQFPKFLLLPFLVFDFYNTTATPTKEPLSL